MQHRRRRRGVHGHRERRVDGGGDGDGKPLPRAGRRDCRRLGHIDCGELGCHAHWLGCDFQWLLDICSGVCQLGVEHEHECECHDLRYTQRWLKGRSSFDCRGPRGCRDDDGDALSPSTVINCFLFILVVGYYVLPVIV